MDRREDDCDAATSATFAPPENPAREICFTSAFNLPDTAATISTGCFSFFLSEFVHAIKKKLKKRNINAFESYSFLLKGFFEFSETPKGIFQFTINLFLDLLIIRMCCHVPHINHVKPEFIIVN